MPTQDTMVTLERLVAGIDDSPFERLLSAEDEFPHVIEGVDELAKLVEAGLGKEGKLLHAHLMVYLSLAVLWGIQLGAELVAIGSLQRDEGVADDKTRED